ncbi:hypothetical protein [Nostoc sp.]|uniref:hypothetical protein n=1 Tax=Nostoc sp. TaxID=1180 RepID=UPI002FFB051B
MSFLETTPMRVNLSTYTLGLRIIVGWVVPCFPVGVRSETQQSPENVGFCPSTQPTLVLVFGFNPSVLNLSNGAWNSRSLRAHKRRQSLPAG